MIPFPHLNLMNCVGMDHKYEYLIWREKNGFFTALDRHSNLFTWSLITGKMLYNEEQTRDASECNMIGYEVYQADGSDITYTRNFYNLRHTSLNLLKSAKAISKEFFVKLKLEL